MKVSFATLGAVVALLVSGMGLGFVLAKADVPLPTPPYFAYLPTLFVPVSDVSAAPSDDPSLEALMLSGSDFGGNAPYIFPSKGGRAGLHLPQGATIVRVTAWYSMTVPITYTTDIVLERQQHGTFKTLATGTILGNQALGEHELVINGPAETVVDNHTFGYRIRLQANAPSSTATFMPSFFDITQIRVDYRSSSK